MTKEGVYVAGRFSKDTVVILVLLVVVIASWIPRLNSPIDLRFDSGVYYTLGTSLAEGKGYRLLNEPGEIAAVQYPPMLSLIVASHQWLLGTSDPLIVGRGLKLSFFLIFIFYILATYVMLRGYLSTRYAFLATVICLFSLHTYLTSNMLAPEIPFALTTVLFFLCHKKNNGRIHSILAAVFAIVSYALRTIGIALLVAWIAEGVFNREFKKAAVRLILSLVPILCWQSYIYYVESGPQYNNPAYEYQRADYMFYNVSYAKNIFRLKDSANPELGYASLGDIGDRFWHNLKKTPTLLGEGVSVERRLWYLPVFGHYYGDLHIERNIGSLLFFWKSGQLTWWFVNSALLVIGCLILGGMVLLVARRHWIMPFYILLSLAAIYLTPWPSQFVRYLTPVAPFLVLSLFAMLTATKEYLRILPAKWKVASLVLTGSIVFLILMQESNIFYQAHVAWPSKVVHNDQNRKKVAYRVFTYIDSERALDAGVDWLQSRAKPDDVVAARMPHWVHLRTGLKTVMPPLEPNPVKAQSLLDSVPVSYLVVDDSSGGGGKYASPMIQNFPVKWKRVYSAPRDNFEIYQRQNSDEIVRRKNAG